ncbi:TonB-dependent receptor [Tsuneonella mangrovi]|uniref:TonB-dependent receptor n=1 Tax=Tsuneonella mangrovi TaxID=1982042 RepID=UPI000BA2B773|nr:TonB-dependent receptor [Tsuneonella mangrovi]
MRAKFALLAGICATATAFPAFAQDTTDTSQASTSAQSAAANGEPVIIVTAQRRAQALQTVPIAVSAFSSEALAEKQIKTTSDLQLSLPNVTFTKTNFSGSSFTIRGIGDLCVGITCDAATAIAFNDTPLFGTRLFESEFFDVGQIQVLRGPQGTLFGRNATSGVVDIIAAKPDLTGLAASGEVEYGNYNMFKGKGMLNIPLSDTLGVRFAGYYNRRDGLTENLYNNTRIDGRDMYAFRGSLRWEPTSSTTVDLMAQYFHERDTRMRIQKQLCQRDPTGVLGCLSGSRAHDTTNGNNTLGSIFASQEFFRLNGIPDVLALGSIYGTNDVYHNSINPTDPRQVYTAFTPQYFTDEWIVTGQLKQELGNGLNLQLSGNYERVRVDSEQDYWNAIQDRATMQSGLNYLYAGANGAFGPGYAAYLAPVANALMPSGPTGPLCTSAPDPNGVGVYGGKSVCSDVPLTFDRSVQFNSSWSAEGIVDSDWDGMFNFLLGGIYAKVKVRDGDYYVDTFGLDYFSGVAGTLGAAGAGLAPSFLATPFYRNNTSAFTLNSYGIFGEGYFQLADNLKLTLGARYNHDKKYVKARTSLWVDSQGASVLVPIGSSSITDAYGYSALDYDVGMAGAQEYDIRNATFSAVTGRAVLDWQITPDNLLYASYSRGYKSGGINPPLSPIFAVPETFTPEYVNAFEIGSKNQFGPLTLNLTAFYYKYKDLQLSRIVARTSVNDNVSANIYGIEAEAIAKPVRQMTVNLTMSYLHTEVSQDKYLSNPRDFGGGRSDAVIIKDITNAANCAVAPNSAGNAAGSNAFVNYVNANVINPGIPDPANPGSYLINPGTGLQGTTSFPSGGGIASTGAFSVCSVLQNVAAVAGNLFDPNGITVYTSGIPVNIRGNQLPGAPNFKVAAGAQYEFPVGDLTFTPRVDVMMTGTSYGSIFNGYINRIPSYTQVNAQVQLDGPDKRWYIKAYVQNLGNVNAITGLYVTDQSSGNFTNIFTLDPRRYGVAAGFKF